MSKKDDRETAALAGLMLLIARLSLGQHALYIALGTKPHEEARKKLKGMRINPLLTEALDKIHPVGSPSGFKFGVDFLRDDDNVWTKVMAQLVEYEFEKRGMAAYFMRYLVAMSYAKSFLLIDEEIEQKEIEFGNHHYARLRLNELSDRSGKAKDLVSILFGYLQAIEGQVPEKPKGFKAWLYKMLWKATKGATKEDYAKARKMADIFLAGSSSNHKITEIVNS